MNKLLVTLVTIAGFQSILFGIMWVASPYNIAASFGIYSLAEGLGLSSQIGDVGAFFTGIGLMMLLAVYTLNSVWFYAPALLLGLTAVYRVLAWVILDASFATQFIAGEVLLVVLLMLTASRVVKKSNI
tara:strand:- start:339 stop:725 length:387 start_codon:yes stop_codon:yes gene_type:complete